MLCFCFTFFLIARFQQFGSKNLLLSNKKMKNISVYGFFLLASLTFNNLTVSLPSMSNFLRL